MTKEKDLLQSIQSKLDSNKDFFSKKLTQEELQFLSKLINSCELHYPIRLTLGHEEDSSDMFDIIYFTSSHPLKELLEAYKRTCMIFDIQLHNGSKHFGNVFISDKGTVLCSEYGNPFITQEQMNLFVKEGFVRPEPTVNDDFFFLDGENWEATAGGVLHLLLWFIQYSLVSFKYELNYQGNLNEIEDFNNAIHAGIALGNYMKY